MRYISLFSGIGALDLAVRNVLGAETEAYVEIDKFCQKVLKARIKDGYLDDAEIFDDIKTFKWEKTDMVVGGFPCQPFSVAGERKGEADERNMWPDTLRVIRMARPQYVFLENVPGLLSGDDGGRQPYVYTVLRDLAEEGFDAEWEVIGADDAGSSHRRKRWFCFAYRKLDDSEYTRLDGLQVAGSFGQGKSDGKTEQGESEQSKGSGCCESGIDKLADTDSIRQECENTDKKLERNQRSSLSNLDMADSKYQRSTRCESQGQPRQKLSQGSSNEMADSPSIRTQVKSTNKREQPEQSKCNCRKLADSNNTGDCTHGYRDDSYRQEKDERWKELPLSESRGYYEDQFPDYPPGPSDSSGWEYLLSIMPEIEPAFCRISDDGKMVNRMDRLKALGNAVAWQAGAIALRLCIERSGVLDGAAES